MRQQHHRGHLDRLRAVRIRADLVGCEHEPQRAQLARRRRHRLEHGEGLGRRFGTVLDHATGALDHLEALCRRQGVGVDPLRHRGEQLLAHVGGDRCPALGIRHEVAGGKQAALLRQPDETRDQRRSVGAAGVAAAVGGDREQGRRIQHLDEAYRQVVGRRACIGSLARFYRLQQVATCGIGVAAELGDQARIFRRRRRVADPDHVVRGCFDHVGQRRDGLRRSGGDRRLGRLRRCRCRRFALAGQQAEGEQADNDNARRQLLHSGAIH